MPDAKQKISATVITKNEATNIAKCLESLSWVDEIVVLDSESTDNTVQIAKRFTDKVFTEPWSGQGRHKNRAAELAQGPWIFSVDADEQPTPELANEIKAVIATTQHSVYAVKRKNYYKSQWIRHSGWWPDWVKRVFRKGDAYFSDDVIHDSLQTTSSVGFLEQPLVHRSFESPEDFLQRSCWYAHNQGYELFRRGKKASAWTAWSHACFSSFQAYFLRMGFLDGAAGLLISVSNFVGTFYRYMILRELCLEKKLKDKTK